MASVTGTLRNFMNGVSQQSMTMRLPTQATEQVNLLSAPVEGLRQRPPLDLDRVLTGKTASDTMANKFHWIDRDETERYVMSFNGSNGGVRVFDVLTGTEQTVEIVDDADYLVCTNPKKELRTYTNADTTFVVNRSVTPEVGSEINEPWAEDCLVHVSQPNYGKWYSLWINGSIGAQFFTTTNDVGNLSSSKIIEQLRLGLLNSGTVNTPAGTGSQRIGSGVCSDTNEWEIYNRGGVMQIINKLGNPFTIDWADDWNQNSMRVYKRTVQQFSELPKQGIAGVRLEVVGTEAQNYANHYVEFQNEDGANSGVWKEIPEPGSTKGMNAQLSPHMIQRDADGVFRFRRIPWVERKAGDNDSCPHPSWADNGRPITDVFMWANRLGFLSGENVILSQDGEYFNFHRVSATALFDDDVIDIAVTQTSRVSDLQRAATFSNSLILTSDLTQFTLKGAQVVAPTTVSVTPETEFDTNIHAPIITMGSGAYFMVGRENNSDLIEYKLNDYNDAYDGQVLTQHNPSYIPPNISSITGNATENLIAMHSNDHPERLYVYKQTVDRNERLQASLSYWQMEGWEIWSAHFYGDKLHVFGLINGTDMALGTLLFETDPMHHGLEYPVYMDNKAELMAGAGVYDELTDTTTFSGVFLAYQPGLHGVAITTGVEYSAGEDIPITIVDATSFTVPGDASDVSLVFGNSFPWEYQLSTIYMRKGSDQGGIESVLVGRLQLQYITFHHTKTNYYKVTVKRKGRRDNVREFTAWTSGDEDAMEIGKLHLDTGSVRVPIMTNNEYATVIVSSDSWKPCRLLSADWRGDFTKKEGQFV